VIAVDLTPLEFALAYVGAIALLYGVWRLGMWWRYNRKDHR